MFTGPSFVANQIDLLDFTEYFDRFKSQIDGDEITPTPSELTSETGVERLSNLENALTQFVLSRACEQLEIINHEWRNDDVLNQDLWKSRQSVKTIFKNNLRDTLYFPPTYQIMEEGLTDMVYLKKARDIKTAIEVFENTRHELEAHGTYGNLKKSVVENKADEDEEFEVIKNYTKSKLQVEYLEKKVAECTVKCNTGVKKLEYQIANMENEIHDNRIENALKTRLIRNWEDTRFDQGLLLLNKQQSELRNEFYNAETKLNIEQRAINEITNFIIYEIENIVSLTEYWKSKYESEIESLDDAIQITKENIIDLELQDEELTGMYNSRQAEIESYWRQKQEEAEAIALAELKCKRAIQIQAWWRGTMVRRHLGPYKKKKRGKGGKAAAKGGGKGKKK